MRSDTAEELLQTAARLVAEEGLDYAGAKRRAHKLLGNPPLSAMPSNDALEEALADYLALFCADTQPSELAALRSMALAWMTRLQAHHPLLVGAVWRGTATRMSEIYIDLFADDCKMVEIELINQGVAYTGAEATDTRGQMVPRLVVHQAVPEWRLHVPLNLTLRNPIEQRGSLGQDARGRPLRGTLKALQALLAHGKTDQATGAKNPMPLAQPGDPSQTPQPFTRAEAGTPLRPAR